MLDLEDNKLESWDEVEKLSQLPNLARLNLSRNSLSVVRSPVEPLNSGSSFFPSLVNLSLARCKIEDVESVDALHRFPRLKEVRLNHNPVTETKCPRYEVMSGASYMVKQN